MKIAEISFEVSNDFNVGDCEGCPLNVIDWSNAKDGFPSHCQLGFDWDKCPIELAGERDDFEILKKQVMVMDEYNFFKGVFTELERESDDEIE